MDSPPRPSCAKAASSTAAGARETAPPALHVTSDTWLFRHIVSFQAGLPVALRQFWIQHDPKPASGPIAREDIAQLVRLVVESGSTHHLDLLRRSWLWLRRKLVTPELRTLVGICIANNRADILRWVIAKGMALPPPHQLWRDAVESSRTVSDFAVLELLHEVYPLTKRDAQRQIPSALYKPSAGLLRWITAHYPTVAFPILLTTAAAAEGDLAVLAFLLEHQHSPGCHINLFQCAFAKGYHDVLDYLITNRAGTMTEDFKEQLVLDNSALIREIIDRHHAVFMSTFPKAFLTAVRAGDREKMPYLYANVVRSNGASISIDDAASWKGLAGLKFLNDQAAVMATTEAMDAAAEARRWDIVAFLHAHRTEGCTTRAVDAAASAGELKWVKFLLENRDEGCTTKTIDGAARGGHLSVVQYLYEHYTEGCSAAAVSGALDNHRVEVVQWLYEHYPNLFGEGVLFNLLLRGAFDIFITLRDEFPEQAARVVETVMVEAGRQFELPTIRFILDDLGRSDLRPLALEGAASVVESYREEWQRTVETVTTPKPSPLRPPSFAYLQLHPLIRDARTPTWAVRTIATSSYDDVDDYKRCTLPFTWAVRAVYHRDLTLLQVIRDLPPGTIDPTLKTSRGGVFSVRWFGYEGARAAAIRVGDKAILEWLLKNVGLPIEATLLDEAVYYHQFEIAEWLLANYPAACTELDWTNKGNETGFCEFGLRDGLLDWLESHDAVRKALPFTGIIDFAARKNDVDSLRRLHGWYPELFTPRPSLIELADLE